MATPAEEAPTLYRRRWVPTFDLPRAAFAGGIVIGVLVLVAIFAPLLAPYEYNQLRDATGPFGAQEAPSSEHWLGTTVGGYDVLSRTIW